MPVDFNQFAPITELDKQEMINWLTTTLDIISDPDQVLSWDGIVNLSTLNNRIFGTNRDDVDEIIDMFGRFAATLIKSNISSK